MSELTRHPQPRLSNSEGAPRADRGCTALGEQHHVRPLPAVERERAAEPRAASDRPAGLVPIATSDTRSAFQPKTTPRNCLIPSTDERRRMRMSRMRRATHCGADLMTRAMEAGGFRFKPAMLTLTYRDDATWRPWHVSKLVKHMRQYMARRGHVLRLCWVAELTERGRVHYHLCVWIPSGERFPKPDEQGWWPHGATRIEWARRPISYMVKYTSKGENTFRLDVETGFWNRLVFPKGCRIHGRSGLERSQRRIVGWWCLPRYVREHFPEVGAWVVRADGGGWKNRDTGEWLAASDWRPEPDGLP